MIRNFEILHSDHRDICIVGQTYPNYVVYEALKKHKNIKLITLEEAQQQTSDSFFQDHQFFSTSSTITFKKKLVDWLVSKNVSFISLIDSSTVVDPGVQIGYNTVIMDNNSINLNTAIGNHCLMVNCITLAHDSTIGDFCHISGYSYLGWTSLETGVVVGLRSNFVPKPSVQLKIPAWSNFLLNSSVNRPIDSAGTYFGNRKISDQTSLTYKLF
jgi:bifunctional N-acetylglucosamine-1-phosphate-uridyltransferase/glucosamine-1-phosphate-acetyltransferase GlmU-like protein